MNGFRIWSLQDLSHVLLARSLQHETRVSTMTFKHCLGSLLRFLRKKETVCETKITNLSAVFNNLGSIFTAPIPLPEIASINFSCRLLAYLLHSETNTKKCLKLLKPLIKYNGLSSLRGNLVLANKYDATHPSVQTAALSFVHDNNVTDKADYSNCNSKLVSSLQDARDITLLQTPAISKPSPPSFVTLQRSSTMTKIQERPENVTGSSAIFSELEIPRNIASEWSSMEQPYLARRYHTRKFSKAEVNVIKGEVQQRGTCLGSSRFNRLKSQKFYASCSKGKNSVPSCEKPKNVHETKKECETKKKCVKGPANCLTRKSITDELQTCQKDKKLSKPAEKSGVEEYCTGKKEPVKDKKSDQELMKEQIDREFKEIEECKRVKEKEKKDDKCKTTTLDYKPTGLDRVISPCKENQKKDQFTSTPSEQISWNFPNVTRKPLSIQFGVINSVVATCTKNATLFNAMFDRSFSTMKVNDQDDVAANRIADNDKIVDNYYANDSDFLHGDELPLYVEVENEEENEVDDHDWVTEQSTVKTI